MRDLAPARKSATERYYSPSLVLLQWHKQQSKSIFESSSHRCQQQRHCDSLWCKLSENKAPIANGLVGSLGAEKGCKETKEQHIRWMIHQSRHGSICFLYHMLMRCKHSTTTCQQELQSRLSRHGSCWHVFFGGKNASRVRFERSLSMVLFLHNFYMNTTHPILKNDISTPLSRGVLLSGSGCMVLG
jgi:hypothetical protein